MSSKPFELRFACLEMAERMLSRHEQIQDPDALLSLAERLSEFVRGIPYRPVTHARQSGLPLIADSAEPERTRWETERPHPTWREFFAEAYGVIEDEGYLPTDSQSETVTAYITGLERLADPEVRELTLTGPRQSGLSTTLAVYIAWLCTGPTFTRVVIGADKIGWAKTLLKKVSEIRHPSVKTQFVKHSKTKLVYNNGAGNPCSTVLVQPVDENFSVGLDATLYVLDNLRNIDPDGLASALHGIRPSINTGLSKLITANTHESHETGTYLT